MKETIKPTITHFPESGVLPEKVLDGIIKCAQSAFGPSMSSEEVYDHLSGEIFVASTPHAPVAGFGVSEYHLWR